MTNQTQFRRWQPLAPRLNLQYQKGEIPIFFPCKTSLNVRIGFNAKSNINK